MSWQFGGLSGASSGTGIGLQLPIGNLASAGDVPPVSKSWAPDSPVSENAAGEPAGSSAGPLPRMNGWLPAARESAVQQSTAQLDSARQDGNEQGEETDAAASTILQKDRVTEDLAPSLAEDRPVTTTLDRVVLPYNLRQAILLDPRVEEMSARACQLAHRLGLARAEGRPKVTANVTGSRQLASRGRWLVFHWLLMIRRAMAW